MKGWKERWYDWYPLSLRIYNHTAYYGCEPPNNNNPNITYPKNPWNTITYNLPNMNSVLSSVPCYNSNKDGGNVLPPEVRSCDIIMDDNADQQQYEAFIVKYDQKRAQGTNYYHLWADSFLPTLALIVGPDTYDLPIIDTWATETVNQTFAQRLERPYRVLMSIPSKNEEEEEDADADDDTTANHHAERFNYITNKYVHFDFLHRIIAPNKDEPFILDPSIVYCFGADDDGEKKRNTRVWPPVIRTADSISAVDDNGHPTRYAGLVWQTQLYVRQHILGLDDNNNNNNNKGSRCPECGKNNNWNKKPVVVWVQRPKPKTSIYGGHPERYMYSWENLVSLLSNEGGFDVRILNATALQPKQLIEMMDQVDILLGVHGAGLTNMVWMRPYHGVVEIKWPKSKKYDLNFYKMSKHLQHAYTKVECYHLKHNQFDHGPMPLIDQQRIFDAVKEVWLKVKKKKENFYGYDGDDDDESSNNATATEAASTTASTAAAAAASQGEETTTVPPSPPPPTTSSESQEEKEKEPIKLEVFNDRDEL